MRHLASRLALAALLPCTLLACSFDSQQARQGKLVILGFDGMDPDLVRQYMSRGGLPNLAKIADEGGFYPLETTHSPESPTAWASFATGVNAGKHNIYGFLVRDTATYLPDLGMVRRDPPRFLFDYLPINPPHVESLRGGTSFWVTAGRAGVRSSILTVPVTYPPEEVPNGELLSGLPLPDIRGTMGTFHYFATDLSRFEEGNTEFGGILQRLLLEDNLAHTSLIGPANPIIRQEIRQIRSPDDIGGEERARLATLEAREDLRIPLTVRWNRDAPDPRTATIDIQGHSLHLQQGEWSRWIDLEFRLNFFVRLRGMAQFYLIDASNELQLYVSPVNWHPNDPPLDITWPEGFAADLYERLGTYRTLGWAEATWALNENRLHEGPFMDDVYRAFEDRAQVILNRLDAQNWDLLVGVIESTDRVQHMMWRLIDTAHPAYDRALASRFGGSIERIYRRCDQFVGQVLDRLEPGTTVLVVSDHGFHTWRKAVNLNTWLVQEGYMTLRQPTSSSKTLDDLFGGSPFWEHVDWSKTRAYAMGLGQIYINLRGRETQGIVDPGQGLTSLADELRSKLLNHLRDPETDTPIVSSVHLRDEIYAGPYLDAAPELQVGFADGYRVSWQTTLGGAPPGIVYENTSKWSGDHGGFDHSTTAGTLITNRAIGAERARIIDIAPTVLNFFGLPVSPDLDGQPLF